MKKIFIVIIIAAFISGCGIKSSGTILLKDGSSMTVKSGSVYYDDDYTRIITSNGVIAEIKNNRIRKLEMTAEE